LFIYTIFVFTRHLLKLYLIEFVHRRDSYWKEY